MDDMEGRLIVLGIDAASPELIRRWANDGKLPAIRSLMDRGISGSVSGVEGFYIGSTWPSFYTGLNPARHGVYRIKQLRSGTYGSFRPFDIDDGVGGTPFWRLASDAGRRVAVLDVPLSRIEPRLNGIQTVEWGGHDSVFGFRTAPPELADEILSGIGPYPLPPNCNARRTKAADFEKFVSGLERAARMRAELTLSVLRREEWDLVVQVFTEAHCAGHQCWHLHDLDHPAHDPEIRAAVGDPLERVYRAIDGAVGEILEHTGDATVLLFSAHGMTHFRGANFLLPEILERLGVSASRPQPPPSRRQRLLSVVTGAASRVARMLPDRVRAVVRPLRTRLDARGDGGGSIADRIDLERSRCFPIANGFPVSGIRLNLAGREPRGVLQPGPEADAFCRDLARDLVAIVDERTGTPLVHRVLRTADLYEGPRRDDLPDLLVEWNDVPTGTLAHANGRKATIRATSPDIGTVEGRNGWGRTGEHLPKGFFVLGGPAVPSGRHDATVSLLDLHPTICRLLGLAEPAVDGAAIPDLAGRTG
jgi:predicted AlkP superfamily phosphohydrolase/phosphomutase